MFPVTTTIINKSQIEDDRWDSEFYQPKFLNNSKLLLGQENTFLGGLTRKIVVGYVSSMVSEYTDEGIDLLQTRNVQEFFPDFNDCIKINLEFHNKLKKSQIKKDDILIARSGSFGNASIYLEDGVVNSADIIIMEADKEKINPFYLTAFINSSNGRLQLYRYASGGLQGHVNTTILHNLIVPNRSARFQDAIQKVVLKAYSLIKKGKQQYLESENVLLSELNLNNFKPDSQLYYTKKFSDTQIDERIDAEFFEPKYDTVLKQIHEYKNGSKSLSELSELVGHPSNPPYEVNDNNNKTFIVTQKHLGDYFPVDGFWTDEEALYTTDEFFENNERFILKKNDIILYSVGAYIGKANLYNSDIKATIGSFLTLIRPRQNVLNPYFLLSFLNSPVGLLLTRRNSRGLAQQYIYPYDTRNISIPLVDISIQLEIEALIKDGQYCHNLAKSLLEFTKKTVEMATENGESHALDWLDQELNRKQVQL